tara:strand:- start:1047 stop:1220 length:174 start_codon:yes stop_codon:yes gene_type:complete
MSKFITTECGIDKFNKLRNQKGIFKKIRFYWFVIIASLRDTVLNRAPKSEHKKRDEI